MSETAHTPGPWEWTKRPDLESHPSDWNTLEPVDWEANATSVLTWAHLGGRNKPYVMCGPANARLIAAAPDLLEACQNLLAQAENLLLHSDCSDEDRQGRRVMQNVARAAIAKATK